GGWRIDGGLARPATRCLPDCRPATIEDEKPSSSLKVGAAIRSPDASGPNFPLSIGRAPRHERQPIAMLDAPTSYANVAIAQAPGAETPGVIFKAMDANKDGFVTLEEMQNFLRCTSGPAAQ